jgi:hypothetical protein
MPNIIDPKHWLRVFNSPMPTKGQFPKSGEAERALSTIMAYADDGDSFEITKAEETLGSFISEAEEAYDHATSTIEKADGVIDDMSDALRTILGWVPNVYLIEDDDTHEVRKWASAQLRDWEYTNFKNSVGKLTHVFVMLSDADDTMFQLRWRGPKN